MQHKPIKRVKRVCPNCKRKFRPRHGAQVYCTVACRQAAYRKRRQEEVSKLVMFSLIAETNLGEMARKARLRHEQ